MLGLGLTLCQVAVRGGGRVIGPQILISNRTQDKNTAIGATIGTFTVVGGTGTYTFSKTADPSSAFTLTGAVLKNAIVFDYETTTIYSVTINANNGAGSNINRTLTIGVNDLDEVAPTILTSSTQSVVENVAFSVVLTADETVTWTKTGGADTAKFTLTGDTLSLPAKDYEAPDDADANRAYVVQVTATDAASNATNKTITVTVTDAVGPTITSSASPSVAENVAFSLTLTASEAATWAKVGGADTALFTLTGDLLTMTAKDYEIPVDADANNTYVVQVTATSVATAEVSATQTITVTVTDVSDTLPAPGVGTLAWTSDTATTPPTFTYTVALDADIAVGDTVRLQRSTVSDFSTGTTDYTNTVDSGEDAAQTLSFSSGTWADGTWWARARTERPGADLSDWSNIETKTLAASASGPLMTNLISYWEFENTSWLDSHTTGNTLTPFNSPTINSAGAVGNMAQLGASSSKHFRINDNTSLNVAGNIDFSIAVWAKYDAGTTGTAIVSKSSGGGTHDYLLGAGHFTAHQPNFRIFDVSNASDDLNCTASIGVSDYRFIVAVADFTNSLLKISVNGSTFETHAITRTITGGTGTLQIGALNNSSFWDGGIDQCGFWKRVLTQDEVTLLHNMGAGLTYAALATAEFTIKTNLISYWEFENTSWLDSHTNGYTLTAVGGSPLSSSGGVGGGNAFDTNSTVTQLQRATNTNLEVGSQDFSIAAWFYKGDTAFTRDLINKQTGGAGNGEYSIYVNAAGAGATLEFLIYNGAGATNSVTASTFGAIGTGAWHMAVCTFNATTGLMTVSVDAGTRNTFTSAFTAGGGQPVPSGVANVVIGNGPSNGWHSKIDQVGFWKRVLTTTEETYLYNSGSGRAYSAL